MEFKMSPNIAVRTSQFSEAMNFYSDVLGFANRSKDPELGDFDAHPLNKFVIEDLESARDLLVRNGCEVIRSKGEGQDCYIRDPYVVIYNIWESQS
jgi:hypothetical protein